jgi:uncharacterized protein (DUF58 family)
MPACIDPAGHVLGRTRVHELPPRRIRAAAIRVRPTRRGRLRIAHVRIGTRFPFQMYDKSLRIAVDAVLWVAPDPLSTRSPRQLSFGAKRTSGTIARLGETEYRGLRERVPTDPPSRIHWKRSATVGTHVVKVFGGEASRSLRIVLRQGSDAATFEHGLREAAGLLEAAMRAGAPVRIEAGARSADTGPAGTRADGPWRLLAQVYRGELPPGSPVVSSEVVG